MIVRTLLNYNYNRHVLVCICRSGLTNAPTPAPPPITVTQKPAQTYITISNLAFDTNKIVDVGYYKALIYWKYPFRLWIQYNVNNSCWPIENNYKIYQYLFDDERRAINTVEHIREYLPKYQNK